MLSTVVYVEIVEVDNDFSVYWSARMLEFGLTVDCEADNTRRCNQRVENIMIGINGSGGRRNAGNGVAVSRRLVLRFSRSNVSGLVIADDNADAGGLISRANNNDCASLEDSGAVDVAS